MLRGVRTTLLFAFLTIVPLALFFLFVSRDTITLKEISNLGPLSKNSDLINYAIREDDHGDNNDNGVQEAGHLSTRHVSSITDSIATTVSVLMPAWEVLVIVSPETTLLSPSSGGELYRCLFQNNATSPARFSGVLPFTNRTTLRCVMPNSVRRLWPFLQPVLMESSEMTEFPTRSPTLELIRWNSMAYESYSTEDDVVLFVKGLHHRQGTNRPPHEFSCVFGDETNGFVKTAVTSSVQEVFRCPHPNLTAVSSTSGSYDEYPRIKISLEIVSKNHVLPSVAYYTPRRSIANPQPKSLVCACTMVYNVAKFLKEWVTYHSKIGVEKFILYDNDSDDDLGRVVKELNQEGYNVTTLFWVWTKTQEAGFSHAAVYAKDSCTWMMFLDVDEFVFRPSWHYSSSPEPANHMLRSVLPNSSNRMIGQVMIKCHEFGPSNQTSNPIEGVTQGYTCRRKVEQRHKSIVLLDAVDPSLLNVIHHFHLKKEYKSKIKRMEDVVVNHYKYQAWSEFRSKFRRRVSAYVIDWTQKGNLLSNDRTPGLGFEPVEPKGWAQNFCEVRDERLKLLTQKWFGSHTTNGYKFAWQR